MASKREIRPEPHQRTGSWGEGRAGGGGGGTGNPTHCSICACKHGRKFEKGFTGGRKRQLFPFVTYTPVSTGWGQKGSLDVSLRVPPSGGHCPMSSVCSSVCPFVSRQPVSAPLQPPNKGNTIYFNLFRPRIKCKKLLFRPKIILFLVSLRGQNDVAGSLEDV